MITKKQWLEAFDESLEFRWGPMSIGKFPRRPCIFCEITNSCSECALFKYHIGCTLGSAWIDFLYSLNIYKSEHATNMYMFLLLLKEVYKTTPINKHPWRNGEMK